MREPLKDKNRLYHIFTSMIHHDLPTLRAQVLAYLKEL